MSNRNNKEKGIEILVVDDEKDIRELISDILKDEGYTARLAKDSDEAFEKIAERIPAAVILDIWLKGSQLDGLGILETVKRKYPSVPVIMISGHGNIETAVNSIKMGAYDYVEKPFKADRLLLILKRALETIKLIKENAELRLKIDSDNVLIGRSNAIASLKNAVSRVAATNSRIFITGSAGSGKEVVARMIHKQSPRREGNFVVLSPAGISQDKMDVELFGTEESGDINSKPRKIGVFEKAHGGTLFIDEIVDMPLNIQSKLLRVLQDQKFERVGGNRKIESNFRVIAASNKNVQEEIASRNLREDLYYRLNVVPLRVPSLNERREDIPELCNYFLNKYSENSNLPRQILGEDAIAALQTYDWPGNVRQLKNVIEWVMIMNSRAEAANTPIKSEMLPSEVFSSTPASMSPEVNTDIMSMPLREARELFERQYLIAQVNRFGGNISRTSSFIGMERSALHRKLRSLNIASYSNEEKVANDAA